MFDSMGGQWSLQKVSDFEPNIHRSKLSHIFMMPLVLINFAWLRMFGPADSHNGVLLLRSLKSTVPHVP